MPSDDDAPIMLKVKRGPKRAAPDAKKVKAAPHIVLQAYRDHRNRLSKEWVEVSGREVGRELSADEQVAALRLVASIRHKAHDKNMVIRCADGQFKAPEPVELAAELLNVSVRVVKRLHADLQREKVLPEGSCRGFYTRKTLLEEIFGSGYLESWTRVVVQRCVAIGKRPSYRDVAAGMQELAAAQAQEKIIAMGESIDSEQDFVEQVKEALSYPRVRRWCQSHKWLFQKITKVKGVVSDTSNVNVHCVRYCERFFVEREREDTVVIYLDESYCNEKHAQEFAVCKIDDHSTWSDVVKDGRRLCFCTAICSYGEIATLNRPEAPHECPSRWIFSPNKDQQKKADYHASFDSSNWQPYFRNHLVPACERVFPQKRLVFVMDNAGYHVSASYTVGATQTPVDRGSRKELLVQFIQAHRGEASARISMLRQELVPLFISVAEELGCDILRFLRERGHNLLLTPPRASTWQPIELYWASCKNEVAKLYLKGRGLVETKNQLNASLTKWGTSAHCTKLIAHATKQVKTWWDAAQRADVAVENALLQPNADIRSDEEGIDDSSSEHLSQSGND